MGVALGGYVYDESDNILPNVTVELNSEPIITTTNTEGYYEIADVPIGVHTLYIKDGETVLGSKEIMLISSKESQIKNNQIYLPEIINKHVNIKTEQELKIFIEDKFVQFAKNFGGNASDYFEDIIYIEDNYIVVGRSKSTDEDLSGLNKGNYDAIIVKYDIDGNILWKKNFGGSQYEFFENVLIDTDGYITIGYSFSTDGDLSGLNKGNIDAIIVKYDLNGNVLWKKNFGGSSSDYFQKIIETEGGYITVGSSQSSDKDLSGLNKGNTDAIIVKYDTNGNVLWKKNFGGSNIDKFEDIIQTVDGYIAVGQSASTNGNLTVGLNKGSDDGIIVKYDLNGNVILRKNYGGSSTDIFRSIINYNNEYIVVGQSNSTNGDTTGINKGGFDGIIVKYDANFNVLAKQNYGGSDNDVFSSIVSLKKRIYSCRL